MKKYVIIDAQIVPSIDFNLLLESDQYGLIYNLDRTQAIVKFEGDTPSFLAGKTQYTHSEILAIVAGEEWTSAEGP